VFHFRHRWARTAIFYAEPVPESSRVRGSYEFVKEIMMGVTTIVDTCSCGKRKSSKYLGRIV
jgi:hypothetical protein